MQALAISFGPMYTFVDLLYTDLSKNIKTTSFDTFFNYLKTNYENILVYASIIYCIYILIAIIKLIPEFINNLRTEKIVYCEIYDLTRPPLLDADVEEEELEEEETEEELEEEPEITTFQRLDERTHKGPPVKSGRTIVEPFKIELTQNIYIKRFEETGDILISTEIIKGSETLIRSSSIIPKSTTVTEIKWIKPEEIEKIQNIDTNFLLSLDSDRTDDGGDGDGEAEDSEYEDEDEFYDLDDEKDIPTEPKPIVPFIKSLKTWEIYFDIDYEAHGIKNCSNINGCIIEKENLTKTEILSIPRCKECISYKKK